MALRLAVVQSTPMNISDFFAIGTESFYFSD